MLNFAADAVILLAGIGAGLAGAIAGLASLVSYPTLLAFGLPPVTANITNTVSLFGFAVGSISGSAPELRGKWRQALWLAAISAVGGIGGAVLLLVIDPQVFTWLVPIFVASGSLLILFRSEDRQADRRWSPAWLRVGVFGVGVYGGFFGPAAGTVLLAVIVAGTGLDLAVGSAVRNVVMSASSCIAAGVFIVTTRVHWEIVMPLMVGIMIGSYLGPWVVRHCPAKILRLVIGISGLGLAAVLTYQAVKAS